jgi:hypothetical protein
MNENPYLIADLAMDSRAYFIDARGTVEEIEEIKRRIAAGDARALFPQRLRKLPEKPVMVHIPEPLALKVNDWIKEMEDRRVRVYGVRTYTKFLHTLRGVALMNGRESVKKEDLDYFYTFRRLWLELPPMPDEEGTKQERNAGLGE